jgi:hypothetical protein
MSKSVTENWTDADLDALFERGMVAVVEAKVAHDAGVTLGAPLLLLASFEAVILGRVVVFEE